jgi:ribonucleoside-diphosphate reductase alpha chain
VRSLPDGVAQVLDEYLRQKEGSLEDSEGANHKGLHAPLSDQFQLLKIGDLCPECGQAAVVNEEGCRKCYACGYSEC